MVTDETFESNLAPGIPIKVIFIFEIPQEVTELVALDVGYWQTNRGTKRVAIPKIGTITTQ
ncbi:MAG: hypothetical protein ACRC8A_10835 [Microcoleaceae cyanobacterium]